MHHRCGWSVFLLAASACSGNTGTSSRVSDEPSPALPASTALRDLTPEQALSLCEWESAHLARGNCLQNAILAGGFRAQISFDPSTVAAARSICTASLERCTAPDEIASGILDCAENTRTKFTHCAITVGDAEKCDADLARDYGAQPRCADLTEDSFRAVLYRMTPASCQSSECGP